MLIVMESFFKGEVRLFDGSLTDNNQLELLLPGSEWMDTESIANIKSSWNRLLSIAVQA